MGERSTGGGRVTTDSRVASCITIGKFIVHGKWTSDITATEIFDVIIGVMGPVPPTNYLQVAVSRNIILLRYVSQAVLNCVDVSVTRLQSKRQFNGLVELG